MPVEPDWKDTRGSDNQAASNPLSKERTLPIRYNSEGRERDESDFGSRTFLMKFTNHMRLSEPIVKALSHDSYDSAGSDLTATQIIDSPSD